MSSDVMVTGVSDIQKMLTKIIPKHAQRIQRSMVQSIAVEVSKEARKKAKAIKVSGNLGKAYFAKKKRSPPESPVSTVSVRRGGKGKVDGFYWRFLEFGTKGKRTIRPTRKNRFKGRKRTLNVRPIAPIPIVQNSRDSVYNRFPILLPKLFVKQIEKEIKREAKRR